MAGRGIEIHDGYVVIPEGMLDEFHLGTEASPLTQMEAGQIVVSAVINVIALGGAVRAGLFVMNITETVTMDARPLHSKVTINDAVTITGIVNSARIQTQILGTGIITGRFEGLLIEMSSAAGAEVIGTTYGIFISNYNLATITAGNYAFVRMQENGTVTVQWALYIRAGGGCEYFAMLHGTTNAWSGAGVPTGNAGWIKLQVSGLVKYIKLWTIAP